MPKRLFRKYLPSPERIRANKSLSFLGAMLGDPNLWHVNRHSLAGAAFIGIFTAFLPIPMQMVVAAVLAVRFKCNLPLSVLLVWITNPFTILPVFYFTHQIGAALMGIPPMELLPHMSEHETFFSLLKQLLDHMTFTRLIEQFGALLLGSLLSGLLLGATAWGAIKLAWRVSVSRKWQQRLAARRQRDANRPS
jgi:uncharacterized protein